MLISRDATIYVRNRRGVASYLPAKFIYEMITLSGESFTDYYTGVPLTLTEAPETEFTRVLVNYSPYSGGGGTYVNLDPAVKYLTYSGEPTSVKEIRKGTILAGQPGMLVVTGIDREAPALAYVSTLSAVEGFFTNQLTWEGKRSCHTGLPVMGLRPMTISNGVTQDLTILTTETIPATGRRMTTRTPKTLAEAQSGLAYGQLLTYFADLVEFVYGDVGRFERMVGQGGKGFPNSSPKGWADKIRALLPDCPLHAAQAEPILYQLETWGL